MSIVGARPQFVKLAAINNAIAKVAGFQHIIVHTGQHYDPNMSDVFFDGLNIPQPAIHLDVGSGTHALQTSIMLRRLEEVILEVQPQTVLVYGDTNTTLAGALAASQLHVPLAHLEAGLRSFNRRMPEELNRVLTDHASDLLLAPTELAHTNLATEGLSGKTVVVGDVMADICFRMQDQVARHGSYINEIFDKDEPYALATLHRPANTDDPSRLASILESLKQLPLTIVLVAHPRLRDRARSAAVSLAGGSLQLVEPLAYRELIDALINAQALITDSGGAQKEAFLLGTPTTTIRRETEWEETLTGSWNVLANDPADIVSAVLRVRPTARRGAPFGAGHAAETAIETIDDWIARSDSSDWH